MADLLSDAPIFVVGFSRSGTSLLRAMLNAHPRVHIAQESAFYQWLRPDRLRRCRTARAWFEGYRRTASFRLLQVDPAPIMDGVPPELPRAEAGRLLLPRVLGAVAAGRPRWGDKTPLHSQRLDAIFADFPDARVIHVTRHPVPTVGSVLRMPWGTDSALFNAALYRAVGEAVARQGERVLTLRLEDLTADPRAVLERALRFIGEEWSEQVLQHDRYTDVTRDPALPWLSAAAAPIQREQRGLPLSPALARLVERITAPAMARDGYAPVALEREPSGWSMLREGLADLGRGLRFLAHALRTAPRFDTPEQIDALAQVRWLFQLNPSPRVPPAWREIPPSILALLRDPAPEARGSATGPPLP